MSLITTKSPVTADAEPTLITTDEDTLPSVTPTATLSPTDDLSTATDAQTSIAKSSQTSTTESSETTSIPNFTSKKSVTSKSSTSSLPSVITASMDGVASAAPLGTGAVGDGGKAAHTRSVIIGTSVTAGVVLIGLAMLYFLCIRPRKPNFSPEREAELSLLHPNRGSMVSGLSNRDSYASSYNTRNSFASNTSSRTSLVVAKDSGGPNEFGVVDNVQMRPSTLPHRRSNLVNSYTAEHDVVAPLLVSRPKGLKPTPPASDYFSKQTHTRNASSASPGQDPGETTSFLAASSSSPFGSGNDNGHPAALVAGRDISRSSWVDDPSALSAIRGSSSFTSTPQSYHDDEDTSALPPSSGLSITTAQEPSYYDRDPRDESSLAHSTSSSSYTSTATDSSSEYSTMSPGTIRSARRQSSRPLPRTVAPPGPRALGGSRA